MTFLDRGPPDAVNEQGTRFWLDQSLSDYCKGKGLLKHYVLLCVNTEDYGEYVLMEGRDPVYNTQSREQMACYIDMINLSQNTP